MGTLHDLDKYRKKKKKQKEKESQIEQTLFQKIITAIQQKWLTPVQAKDLHDFLMNEFGLQFKDMGPDNKLALSEHARRRRQKRFAGEADSMKAGLIICQIKIIVERKWYEEFTPQQAVITVRNLRAIYGLN